MPITISSKKQPDKQATVSESVELKQLSITANSSLAVFANVTRIDGEIISSEDIILDPIDFDNLPQDVQDAINLTVNYFLNQQAP